MGVEGVHQNCFRCAFCHRQLTLASYTVVDDDFFCSVRFFFFFLFFYCVFCVFFLLRMVDKQATVGVVSWPGQRGAFFLGDSVRLVFENPQTTVGER